MSDLREALNEAFTASEEPVSAPEPAEPSSPPAEAPVEPASEPAAPEPSSDDRARDALGRFTKPDQADGKGQTRVTLVKPPVALPDASQTQPDSRPALPTFEKPPRDIPIPLRSHWTGLAPEWRQHITEAHQKLALIEEQYQPSVNFTGRFLRTIEPYRNAIQIEAKGDPIAAVEGLMEVANTLRFGSTVEKANRLAAIIKHYEVDIQALDNALAGVAQPEAQGTSPLAIQQAVQQALAPLLQGAQQRRAQQEQKLAAEIQTEFEKFAADPKNEYFEDVRMSMADLLEVAERQGYQMSNEDAYQRACMLHPEISKIMLARQRDQSAQNLTQAAQRAKAAAVSVKGAAPVGNPAPTAPTSVRAAIEAAMEEHSRV